ncbi:alkene reductase [Chitinophaga caeni]|uniref:Alkene reductase n=1 Tax=Chitinophaga caeni TaxID=2029983 RepID=A0A291QVX6_9BACT|nr:alkene reductase [Chitinophaga caeni]ATL48004.1 alkene reductase [Chitinophaga caeni]
MDHQLFEPYQLGRLQLKNRIVMAPMTRSRAIDNLPNELISTYYQQRASAGLIIVEGTAPSINGCGYCRIPGIYTEEQVKAWQQVTTAVHGKGGHIFLQIMHTGRVAHPHNIPEGGNILAPSAIAIKNGHIYTDKAGMQPYALPKEMDQEDIDNAIEEHVTAAKNAVAAGFDGIELHAAYGYLVEQFLSPNSNRRTDAYGGSPVKRAKFLLDLCSALSEAIGADRLGVRISPYNTALDIGAYPEPDIVETYRGIAGHLNDLQVNYLHISSQPQLPASFLKMLRSRFNGSIIICGQMDNEKAQEVIAQNLADLVAFGKPFLANPDFVERLKNQLPLNEARPHLYFTPGEEGLIDYPFYQA